MFDQLEFRRKCDLVRREAPSATQIVEIPYGAIAWSLISEPLPGRRLGLSCELATYPIDYLESKGFVRVEYIVRIKVRDVEMRMTDIENIPYLGAYRNITRALQAIQKAQTPGRFTQDFLATKLGLTGGGARPVIPFLKKTGFLASDGSPTSLYKRFRNPASSGNAAAEALRRGYGQLYEINEYVHELSDPDLTGVIVQATGADQGSSTVRAMVGSYKALKAFAKFDEEEADLAPVDSGSEADEEAVSNDQTIRQLNLGYTINIHLPNTSDIAVFNAIFRSLRENLLK